MKKLCILLYPLILILLFIICGCKFKADKINRYELVNRHKVQIDSIDLLSPVTVGNGRFAFTADFTGLQTFPIRYEKGIPLGTQSEWGWHSYPNTEGYTFDESLENYNYYGREIPFSVQIRAPERKRDAVNYLRQNPHRLHLGVVGLELLNSKGTPLQPEDISSVNQTLNPWNGEIHSTFKIGDDLVEVITYSHQEKDMIAAKIISPLIRKGLLKIKLLFPYPTGQHSDSGCDFDSPEKHSSVLTSSKNTAKIARLIDDSFYNVFLEWKGIARITEREKHLFLLEADPGQSQLLFSCLFTTSDTPGQLPDFKHTAADSKKAWKEFWMSGGAVDLSGSTDPRASELERRIILSQYLTKVQCTGHYPPQETGLTYNSWHGKFHLEMHYWHGIHFALWDRTHLLENSLGYYNNISGKARETASRQGFDGLRWPKMTDPSGNDSPSGVGSFLIWQQPHIIYMAELCYRNTSDETILRKYSDVVFGAADFMASFAWYDSRNKRFVLGPPMIPAQERFPAETTMNSPFELAYWHWCLSVAQEWRKRLKLEPDQKWASVIGMLSPLAQKDGLYLSAESATDSYSNQRFMSDHPMVTGTYGMLPNSRIIEFEIMKKTFDHVWEHWQWSQTWGWDFPMTAMAATRLGFPDKAIEALFMDVETNTYLPNGHNFQNQRLKLYLPGNGALLTAVAMMCAGWDEAPESEAPGFPRDGNWKVKWEDLKRLP
ncbi:MAG: hypothetical protein GX876_00720 [Bacteroidales bacterium]|nr:hypothetical protein [Bacteroidales bacterium]